MIYSKQLFRILVFSIALLLLIPGLFLGKLIIQKNMKVNDQSLKISGQISETLPPPEISGWIAWWKEDAAYNLLQKYPGKIKSVSPVWFRINESLDLEDVGEVDRNKTVTKLKSAGIMIFPSLGSELNAEQFSPLLDNAQKQEEVIGKFVSQLTTLGVDGADIDLEGIKKEDKDLFSLFLSKISDEFKKRKLTLIITIHARTDRVEWEGVLGQDIQKIGQIADTVRIMTYDKHSASTEPGAIAPLDWIKDVAIYNSRLINKKKIVFGIPSYGYVWNDDDSRGLQFDEFGNFLAGKNYTKVRDNKSDELIYRSNKFEGWLSDSQSMIAKIEHLRTLGFNKFVIWHLGGMDEKFFEKNW